MYYHTSPSYSLTIRLSIERKPGVLGKITTQIGRTGGLMGAISIVQTERGRIIRDLIVYARDQEHESEIVRILENIPEVKLINVSDRTFDFHRGGKVQVTALRDINNPDDLAIAYTPGVGRVSLAVADNMEAVYDYTMKGNTVGIVTDGSAVLGLGNIGPYGALPVMEGKSLLFKKFAGINAFPICLNTTDVEAIIATVKAISHGFGGINLEDISAPRCFEIETRLRDELGIPVFHDDQHGTAIAVLAALKNALVVVDKKLEAVKIVISGVGAAGVACAKILLRCGASYLIACDTHGAIFPGRSHMNPVKEELAGMTNPDKITGSLKDVLTAADVFIGVSAGNILKPVDLGVMNSKAIVFALSNPIPEVDPEGATAYASVVATGRSDFPNQINNVLVFPGIFRGALDAKAEEITEKMELAAAEAIAQTITADELSSECIIPTAFHSSVARRVAEAVKHAAEG